MPQKLSDDHLLPSKLQRYKRGETFAERAQSALFNRADDILDEVYCDICNGVSRSDITQKLMNQQYKPQRRKMTYRTAQCYYNAALDRMHFNSDIEHQRLKDVFFSRYESLLEEAVKEHDIFNARGILDSMAKIFLTGDFRHPGGASSTSISVDNDSGKVTISFGFDKDDDGNNIIDIDTDESEL